MAGSFSLDIWHQVWALKLACAELLVLALLIAWCKRLTQQDWHMINGQYKSCRRAGHTWRAGKGAMALLTFSKYVAVCLVQCSIWVMLSMRGSWAQNWYGRAGCSSGYVVDPAGLGAGA